MKRIIALVTTVFLTVLPHPALSVEIVDNSNVLTDKGRIEELGVDIEKEIGADLFLHIDPSTTIEVLKKNTPSAAHFVVNTRNFDKVFVTPVDFYYDDSELLKRFNSKAKFRLKKVFENNKDRGVQVATELTLTQAIYQYKQWNPYIYLETSISQFIITLLFVGILIFVSLLLTLYIQIAL